MSTPGGESRLDDSVIVLVDKCVCARPMYGWGWAEGDDERSNTSPVDVPSPFSFRITEFFDWKGERRGGIGHVEEVGHPYHEHWLLFYTRQVGHFDFSQKIAYYNFHLGRNRPALYPPSKDPRMAEAWPLPHFPGCPSTWGYGRIGMSLEVIEQFERERLREWEAEKRPRATASER